MDAPCDRQSQEIMHNQKNFRMRTLLYILSFGLYFGARAQKPDCPSILVGDHLYSLLPCTISICHRHGSGDTTFPVTIESNPGMQCAYKVSEPIGLPEQSVLLLESGGSTWGSQTFRMRIRDSRLPLRDGKSEDRYDGKFSVTILNTSEAEDQNTLNLFVEIKVQ
jgi:hypothetical protein